jgi:transcriptional regulator with XRE-family HTH domain
LLLDMLRPVPRPDSTATVGAARSRHLRHRLASELATSRRAIGISQREVARRVGASPQTIARAEAGEPSALTIDLAARLAPALGLQLAASLYPFGEPVRDTAHLGLISRFRARLHPGLRWRVEVPIPIAGDPRSADALIEGGFGTALVEAETHLGDIQAIERKTAAKARDLGVERLILLVSDTRHNRSVTRLHPELRERFPVDTRTCLGSLGRGSDPGGDCLVVL